MRKVRNSEQLLPDHVLGLIFNKLSLIERLIIVPSVCKSWNHVVLDPYYWQNIDIHDWSFDSHPVHVDRALRLAITQSSGGLREIRVTNIKYDLTFSFLADHARSLRTLLIPGCDVSDLMVEQVAEKLSGVTHMDLSYCYNIGSRGLTAIGKNCKRLVRLQRNMHSRDFRKEDEEVMAIAANMPRLKHLQLIFNCKRMENVMKIIESCLDLEELDVRGCWDVDLDPDWLEKFAPKVRVLGPSIL